MEPSDSLHSYRQHAPVEVRIEHGGAVRKGIETLPKDVLEALKNGDHELAMFLLDQYQEAELGMGPRSDSFLPRMIKKFFYHIRFPSFERASRKKVSRQSKMTKLAASMNQIFVPVVKAMSRALIQMVKLPVVAVAKAAEQAAKFVAKQIVTPMVNLVTTPLIQITEKIAEGYRVIEQAIAKATQQFREIREKVQEKGEKFLHEVKELAEPVRLWLGNKFQELVKHQKWAQTALGKQIAEITNQSINVVAYAMVPVTFCIKKGAEKYRQAIQKIGKSGKQAFSKMKKWFNKKMAKLGGMLEKIIETFSGAAERVAKSLLKRFLQFLKWLMKRVFQLYRKLLSVFKS